MAKPAFWTAEHADFMTKLLAEADDYSHLELSTKMSKHFKIRITPTMIGALFTRMRKPGDTLYRAVPYKKRGARRS
jgi:hypothetical protein